MADSMELSNRLPRPIAFVLGGGGSWGALQLGMLQALARTDIRPDLVVGTSVGSLNGAVLAADPAAALQRLEELWPTVTRTEIFPGGVLKGLRTLTTSKAWMFDNEPLTDYLTKSLPAETFEELALPFVAVATDFRNGGIAELDSGELRSALLASSAIPGIYPWVERDGMRLVDGALVANVPITVAAERGARSLVVLDCGLHGVEAGDASSLIEVLAQSAAILARRQIATDLERCAHLPMLWLSRGQMNTTTMLDFSMTATLIEDGFQQSMRTLHSLGLVTELPPGLYGAPAELGAHPLIRPLVRVAGGSAAISVEVASGLAVAAVAAQDAQDAGGAVAAVAAVTTGIAGDAVAAVDEEDAEDSGGAVAAVAAVTTGIAGDAVAAVTAVTTGIAGGVGAAVAAVKTGPAEDGDAAGAVPGPAVAEPTPQAAGKGSAAPEEPPAAEEPRAKS